MLRNVLTTVWLRFWSWCFGETLNLDFSHSFEALVWSWLWGWYLVKILKLKFGRDFGTKDWSLFWARSLVNIWKLKFNRDLKLNFDQLVTWHKNSHFGESRQPLGLLCLWHNSISRICFWSWRVFSLHMDCSEAGSTNWWNAVCLEFLSKKSSQEEIFWTWPWNHNQFWRTTILSTSSTVESWLYSEVRCRLFIYSSLCQSLWVRRRSNYWASLLCCLLAAMVMFTPLMKETQSSYDAIVRWKLQR